MSGATTPPSSSELTTLRSDDTRELISIDREQSELKSSRSTQTVDARNRGMTDTAGSRPKMTRQESARNPGRRSVEAAAKQAKLGCRQPTVETTVEVASCADTPGMTGDTGREALQAGDLSSDLWCLILRGSGTGESDDVGYPVPKVRLRLAARLASAHARMVKYRSSCRFRVETHMQHTLRTHRLASLALALLFSHHPLQQMKNK